MTAAVSTSNIRWDQTTPYFMSAMIRMVVAIVFLEFCCMWIFVAPSRSIEIAWPTPRIVFISDGFQLVFILTFILLSSETMQPRQDSLTRSITALQLMMWAASWPCFVLAMVEEFNSCRIKAFLAPFLAKVRTHVVCALCTSISARVSRLDTWGRAECPSRPPRSCSSTDNFLKWMPNLVKVFLPVGTG